MHSMEQYWHVLRTITHPRITIPNITFSNQQSPVTISSVNPPSDQPGHSRHGISESSRSHRTHQQPLTKRGGENRPPSRKRNDCFSARAIADVKPQQVRNSLSSNAPPDKKVLKEKIAPTRKMSQLKLVVSEASVLPSPPTPQQPEP